MPTMERIPGSTRFRFTDQRRRPYRDNRRRAAAMARHAGFPWAQGKPAFRPGKGPRLTKQLGLHLSAA